MLLALLPLAAGACSNAPYAVPPPPELVEALGQVPGTEEERRRWEPRSEPVVLSYCYNNRLNEPQEILALARRDCEGGRLELREQDAVWNGCAILQPVRVSYVCYPPKPEDFIPAPPP